MKATQDTSKAKIVIEGDYIEVAILSTAIDMYIASNPNGADIEIMKEWSKTIHNPKLK